MKLTLTQSFHRTQDLGGLIKAAESALADCEADAAAKQHIASVAVEAVDKARATLDALKQEREDLAVHMAEEVRKVGEAPAADAEMFPAEHWPDGGSVSDAFADFGHPAQNGLDTAAIDEAYDRAVNP